MKKSKYETEVRYQNAELMISNNHHYQLDSFRQEPKKGKYYLYLLKKVPAYSRDKLPIRLLASPYGTSPPQPEKFLLNLNNKNPLRFHLH